jgi:hypothetical protein
MFSYRVGDSKATNINPINMIKIKSKYKEL